MAIAVPAAIGLADEKAKGKSPPMDSALAEWTKADAYWMFLSLGEDGLIATTGKTPRAGAIPVVEWSFIQKSKPIPQPKGPFGVSFEPLSVNDGLFKLVKGFDNLECFVTGLSLVSPAHTSEEGAFVRAQLPSRALDPGLARTIARDSAEGLKEIAKLKKLRFLGVSQPLAVDALLKESASAKQLQWLSLHTAKLSDEGMKELSRFEQLVVLDVSQTSVTDEGVKAIGKCEKLLRLDLMGTGITDAALETVAKLPKLRELNVARTKITDAGVRRLTSLKELERLCLVKTKVSDAAVADLKKALPKLKTVDRSQAITD